MALNPGNLLRPAASGETAPGAPLAGSRAQAVQRLQVGLLGLAVMILLIGLASVINTNKQQNEAQVVPEAAATSAAVEAQPVSDPLADAGAVPDMPQAVAPVQPAGGNDLSPQP